MAAMQMMTCLCGCGRSKQVRTADVKRGWGKYYSKGCKARHQNPNPSRGRAHRSDDYDDYDDYDYGTHPFSSAGIGQDGYGM